MLAWTLVSNGPHGQRSGDKAKCPKQGKGENQRSFLPSTKARVPNGQKLSGRKENKNKTSPLRSRPCGKDHIYNRMKQKKKEKHFWPEACICPSLGSEFRHLWDTKISSQKLSFHCSWGQCLQDLAESEQTFSGGRTVSKALNYPSR